MLLLLAASLILLATVSYLTDYRAKDQIRLRATETITVYAANLASEISRYEAMPVLLARTPLFKQLLNEPENTRLIETVNRELKQANQILGTLDVYIINRTGRVIASSNYDKTHSYINEDLNFRPYFKDAMASGSARYFALGTRSQKRGYYFAATIPEYGGNNETSAGVLVVKADLVQMESAWAAGHELVTVTDSDGVFFISSNPDWLYHSLKPLSDTKLDEIERNRRFPGIVPQPLNVDILKETESANQQEISLTLKPEGISDQRNYMLLSYDFEPEDWTIHIWNDLASIKSAVTRAQTIAILFLLALFLLATLFQNKYKERQRQRLAAQESHDRLQAAYGELEVRVAERTEELSLSNTLLRTRITERDKAEKELRQAQDSLVHAGKMAAIGQMATSITHELNQPLSAIRTFADNASTYLQRDQQNEADNNLQLISRMTERMNDIMRHLKSFSRKTPLTLQAVNLQAVIDETLLILTRQLEGIDLKVDFDQDTPLSTCVNAEGVRLQQVLTNLLSNAIDALKGHDDPCISIRVSQAGEEQAALMVSVKDNGPGIPNEIFKDLFEPFHTLKSSGDGLGLGLAISHSIIREFGGELAAENNHDGGACFHIKLHKAATSAESGTSSNKTPRLEHSGIASVSGPKAVEKQTATADSD